MPDNDEFLFDEDASSPDWIEISNQGDEAIDLDGWFLTDEVDNLDKWQFPSATVEAGQSIVVFASGKDRTVSGSELHTDFKLSASGESLMLVRPDGIVASQFIDYPMVPENISYGTGLVVLNQALVEDGASARLLVPSIDNGGDQLGASWLQTGFDDTGWTSGRTSIGFGGGDLTTPTELHWTLDQTSLLVLDDSGNGYNALRLPGNASSSTDVAPLPIESKRSLSFDGVNDAIVANSYEGILEGNGRSISTWIKTSATPTIGTYAPTLVHWGGEGTGGRFTFRLNENPNNGTVGALRLEVAGGFVVANTDITDGQWHHVAVAFDPADGGGVNSVQLFVDGVDDGSSGQGNNVAINTVAGTRVTLGNGPSDGVNRNYEGLMDDVRIYNSAVSADDVTALFSGNGPSTGIGTDVSAALLNNNASVFVRVPFTVENVDEVDELTLDLRTDDGFVAYINGQEVARNNAPATAAWNATATSEHSRDDVVSTVIPVTDGMLQNGVNVLSIHGLNVAASDNDLLVSPALTGTGVTTSSRTGYFAAPTAGVRNDEVDVQSGVTILNVGHSPSEATDTDDITVTAQLSLARGPIDSATLFYRVGYGDEIAVPMTELGDGAFDAIIPAEASAAGEMVRWYVTAKGAEIPPVSRSPLWDASVVEQDNAPEYYGTMIIDPSVASDLPVLYWFDDDSPRTSVYFDGEFYDNVFFRVRGASTSGLAKKSYKFDFNRGNHFRFDPNYPRVSEINLNTTITDKAYIRQSLAFDTYDAVGAPGSVSFPMRIQQNGEFFSVAAFIEQPDEDLLAREGLDPEGALYKMFNTFTSSTNVEKKTRQDEGNDDLAEFVSGLNGSRGEDLRTYVFDHVDVPGMVSYLVATVLTQNGDQQAKNHYLYRDTNGTDEWFMLPWDLDLTFGLHFMTNDNVRDDEIWADADNILGGRSSNVPISPSHPYAGEQEHPGNRSWNRMLDKLFELPEFREMFLRRLRTSMDELLGAPELPTEQRWTDNRIDRMVAQIGDDATLDYNAWANPWDYGLNLSIDEAVDRLKTLYLDVRRTHLFETHSVDNLGQPDIVGIPDAQTVNTLITFGQVVDSPVSGNQDEEFIELVNSNDVAVDISGWRLTGGVQHTFKPGTIIRAGESMYVSPNVAAFRSRATGPTGGQGLFVQGDYSGHLSRFGELVELTRDDGSAVASFTTSDSASDVQRYLRVSELHFNPDAGDDKEFMEFTNVSTGADAVTLNLSGAKVTQGFGDTFEFAAGTTLAPGEFLVIVRDEAAFRTAYPDVPVDQIAGVYSGALANGGERVKVEDAENGTVLDFTYDDVDPWYARADGAGASLVAELDGSAVATESFDEYFHWRPSVEFGGSPGRVAATESLGVVINEVLTNSDELPDAIELLNTTSNEVDVSGWFLSDSSGDLLKYEIPAGTILAAGEYVVFDETDFNPTPLTPGAKDFGLNGAVGDEVWLVAAEDGVPTRFVDDLEFGPLPNDKTFARVPDATGRLALSARNTLGCENSLQHLSRVVISEIHYAPSPPSDAALLIDPSMNSGDLEFIEIHNPTNRRRELTGWRLRGGVDYDFAEGQSLREGETLIVVSFNPASDANQSRVAAFRAHYGLEETVTLVGGYADQLSNSGEAIRLQRPDTAPADDPTLTPYVTVEEILYDDTAPWPTSADGSGDTLTRRTLLGLGNDPQTWTSGPPSPGTVTYEVGIQGDMNGDDLVASRDIDSLIDAINSSNDYTVLDTDANGRVNGFDLEMVLASIGSLPGDANLDGRVDASDLNVVGLNWQQSNCRNWATGDFTGDGIVNSTDLNVIGLRWQQAAAAANQRVPKAALATVDADSVSSDDPEPSKARTSKYRDATHVRRSGVPASRVGISSVDRNVLPSVDELFARWER